MCHQENCNLEMNKNQQLNEIELGKIESKLDEGWNGSKIARYLRRDESCVRKEIRNFSIETAPRKNYEKRCANCSNFDNCNMKKLCDDGCFNRNCRGCFIAPQTCKEYTSVVSCIHLKGKKRVCNGCDKKYRCNKPKRIYCAVEASIKHSKNRKKSKKKEKLFEKPKLQEFLQKTGVLIKKGISPEVALRKLENDYEETVSLPTIYEYIDKQLINCTNMDLRNKLKRKPKKEKRISTDKRKHRANGRSYDDLPVEAKGTDSFGSMEMDTVEGVKGGNLLLTLLEKQTDFLFGIPIKDKKQESVVLEFDKLEATLEDSFSMLFRTVLTDNGVEFLNFDGIETGINGEKRTSLFYANPYASYQKGTIENQHRLIRFFYPKGRDFTKYKDAEINKQINKINNYPRKKLGWKSPYELMSEKIGTRLLEKLGFYYIPLDELNMKNTA